MVDTNALPSGGRVVVTHAEGMMQAAIVRALLERGAHVALVGADQDRLMNLARLDPKRVTVVVGDVSSPKQRLRVIPHAIQALGGLDAAVIGANLVVPGGEVDRTARDAMAAPLPRLSLVSHAPPAHAPPPFDGERLALALDTNVIAPSVLVEEAAKVLAAGEGGSLLVLLGAPEEHRVTDLACRQAIETLTRGLAVQYAANVRINALSIPDGVRPDAAADLGVHLLETPGMTGTIVPVPRPL